LPQLLLLLIRAAGVGGDGAARIGLLINPNNEIASQCRRFEANVVNVRKEETPRGQSQGLCLLGYYTGQRPRNAGQVPSSFPSTEL
jgi:hypothetical protein